MGISLFMNFQVKKRLFSLFSKQPPTARIGGKHTASRRMKAQAHYFQLHPLGIHFEMPSRSNTTLLKVMRTNTSNGPHYGKDETKMCRSSQTFFIPFAHSWVSNILIYIRYKYHDCLHRYIQEEMEFLDISSLGTTYRYAVKIEQKFK